MSLFRRTPGLGGPRARVVRSGSTDALIVFTGPSSDQLAALQTQKGFSSLRSNSYTALVAYLSADRYYCQVKEPDGTTVATVVVTSGLSALPAAMVANATMDRHVILRLSGTFGSNDALTPNTHTNFKGGRGIQSI